MKKNYFAFYETFADHLRDLDEPVRLRFYGYIIEYGLYGKEPELSGFEAVFFRDVKFAIDNQRARSKTNTENAKSSERKQNRANMSETERTQAKASETERTRDEEEEEVEGEEEKEEGGESAAGAAFSPPFPPNQVIYAKEIHGIWEKAGLPLRPGGFSAFLQSDFKNAHVYLKGMHSDDVMQAVRNFAETVSNPGTDPFWKRQQPTFEAFCRGKLLPQFLPGAYRAEKYLRDESPQERAARDAAADKERAEARRREMYRGAPKTCPDCGKPFFYSGWTGYCEGRCGAWVENDGGGWKVFRKGGVRDESG